MVILRPPVLYRLAPHQRKHRPLQWLATMHHPGAEPERLHTRKGGPAAFWTVEHAREYIGSRWPGAVEIPNPATDGHI